MLSITCPPCHSRSWIQHPDGVMVPPWWSHSLNITGIESGQPPWTPHTSGACVKDLFQFVPNKVTPSKFSPGYLLCSSYNAALLFPVTKTS